MDNKRNIKVVKNKEMIQSHILTTARYNFSVDEKRILLKLIEMLQMLTEGERLVGKITRNRFDDYIIECPISNFVPHGQKNYERIKAALRALNEKKFEYDDTVAGIWQIIRIIEKPYIEKGEEVRFELNPKIVDCFRDLTKGYHRFELNMSMNLRSVHSMRMYEMVSNGNPITWKLEELRKMFGLEEKYKDNSDFIRRVIIPAKKELDAKSPFTFKYTLEKYRRKIVAITIIPLKQSEFQDEKLQEKSLQVQESILFLMSRNLKVFLKNTFDFSTKELKQNHSIFMDVKMFLDETHLISVLGGAKGRAFNAVNPKGYIINIIKKEIEKAKKNRVNSLL